MYKYAVLQLAYFLPFSITIVTWVDHTLRNSARKEAEVGATVTTERERERGKEQRREGEKVARKQLRQGERKLLGHQAK